MTEDKNTIRENMLRFLEGISADKRAAKGVCICQNLRSIEAFGIASTIFAYAPLPTEPDISSFLADVCDKGKLALPRSLRDGSLVFHRVGDLSKLVEGTFGIPEPCESWPTASVGTGDVILVPGLAFTVKGVRLGRGGGYYDRFVSSLSVDHCRVSACYSVQIVEQLPREQHDQGVDYLVTENKIIETLNR